MSRTGKSFQFMNELKYNIETGLNCVIATHDPKQTIAKFKEITGDKLKLEQIPNSKDVYTASIIL